MIRNYNFNLVLNLNLSVVAIVDNTDFALCCLRYRVKS